MQKPRIKKSFGLWTQRLIYRKRGAVFGAILLLAMSAAIVVYGLLIVITSSAQEGTRFSERVQARYAAEAGIVWAMQQMWIDSTWSETTIGNIDLPQAIVGYDVDVFVPACGLPPCGPRQITANVTYF